MGEIVKTIDAYLGYVVIGLNSGFRFCTPDTDGNLSVGPLVETGTSVNAFAAVGQYLYFGWTNYDDVSTGVGRMDIANFVSTNQPAYASDLMATTQGDVVDIHEFDGDIVFTVAGSGAYRPDSTNLVSSGTLETGTYRWGVPDGKFIPKWDIRTEPLNGSIVIQVSNDSSDYLTVGTMSSQSYTEATFDGSEVKVFEAKAKFTLSRSSSNASIGPVLARWMARAYAAPIRSEIFSVPILLHHKINTKNQDYWFDVDQELSYLRDLVDNPRVISYQENVNTHSVIVEDVRWNPLRSSHSHSEWDWDGTAIVIMRSVR